MYMMKTKFCDTYGALATWWFLGALRVHSLGTVHHAQSGSSVHGEPQTATLQPVHPLEHPQMMQHTNTYDSRRCVSRAEFLHTPSVLPGFQPS